MCRYVRVDIGNFFELCSKQQWDWRQIEKKFTVTSPASGSVTPVSFLQMLV